MCDVPSIITINNDNFQYDYFLSIIELYINLLNESAQYQYHEPFLFLSLN